MADYEVDISTRYRDSDAMGHVNNAVYSSFMEHAATEFFGTLLDVPTTAVPLAIVRLELDFEGQIEVGATVTSAVSVDNVGETSSVFDHELRVDDHVVASATAVRVAMDETREGAIPIPDEWQERLSSYRP